MDVPGRLEPRDRARERFDAGRQLGRRRRADRPPLVALALTLLAATPLAAQTRPPHWERFAAWRAELATDAHAALAAWGAKADARLAWLHEFATADRPTAEFDEWLAADADSTMLAIRMALRDRAAADWRRVADESVRFVAAQKERGRFDAATASARAALAAIPPGAADFVPLHLELAECERRAYRWSAADAALAEAARQPGAASAASAIAAQRAALALARGLPDLAVAEVEAAERAAADPWQRAQALFVRLRLAHALRRPEDAIARLEAFLALPGPGDDDVATREAWQRRIAQLRIRAAIAALAEPQDVNTSAAAAASWLRAVAADPTTSSDERALALTTLTSHLLDRGELDEAPRLLADARATLAAASVGDDGVDERRVAIATLTLRRARLAGDAASRLAAGTELGALWRDLVDRWQSQPSSRVGEGPLHFGDLRRALVELLRARLDDGGTDDALAEVLRTSATGSLARRLGAGAPTTAMARAMLAAAGTGALVFVVGHDASVAFAVDGERTTAHVLPFGAAAIDGRRRELLRALEAARQTSDVAGLDEACRRCAETLLPPELAARIDPWPRVAIVGLDSLGYLPFELLRRADGQRLGVRHAVSYLPSLAIGAWLEARRRHEPATAPRVRLLACADTEAPADAPERPAPIPFDATDLAGSEAACAGVALEIRRGAEADATAAFATADVDFAQILTHGIRDERRSDPQGLLLGDGGVHWPAEVEGGRSAPYVWFAACRAGRGRLRRGDDGRHQLSGAALIAGARAVVLPTLDVGYRGALATSADVHRALWQEGRPLVDALQEARRAADARGPAEVDAFLFHLVGLGERPLVRTPIAPSGALWPRAAPWLAAACLAALALALRQRATRAAR